MAERDAGDGPPIAECARIVREAGGPRPAVHLVLGSGLGGLAERVEDPVRVPFGRLPGFPRTSVEGHEGCFLAGRIAGVPVLVQAGRFHFYEGAGAEVVTAPVRVGCALGAGTLVLTNSAGGIRRDLRPGGIVLVEDHLNLMFRSPLTVPPLGSEAPFPNLSRPYNPGLMALAGSVALEMGIELPLGVYGAVTGPNFETPAEVRALRSAGADLVGMSSVPEATVARAAGQRVLAFSVVTNRASGLESGAVAHADVMRRAEEGGEVLASLLARLIGAIGDTAEAAAVGRSG